jgi:hypothetical protein
MRAGVVGSIVALIVITGAVVSRLGWIGLVLGPLLFLTLVAAEIGFLWLWIEHPRLTWLGILGIASIAVLSVALCGRLGCSAENIVFAALACWLVAVGVVLLKRVVWWALGRR